MSKVKIKEIIEPQYYDLTLRYSLKSFPKNKTHGQYATWLFKKLKLRSRANFNGPYEQRSRMSIYINQVPEKEKRRICNKAKLINDGVFREILVYKAPK